MSIEATTALSQDIAELRADLAAKGKDLADFRQVLDAFAQRLEALETPTKRRQARDARDMVTGHARMPAIVRERREP